VIKNTSLMKILFCICFCLKISLGLVVSLAASQIEYETGLRAALAGQRPFFTISVSRATKSNTEMDYLPLTATERFFVRSVLEMILSGGQLKATFAGQLEAAFAQDLTEHGDLQEKLRTVRSRLDSGEFDAELIQELKQDWLGKFPKEKQNVIWNEILQEGKVNLTPQEIGIDPGQQDIEKNLQRAVKNLLSKKSCLGQEIEKKRNERAAKSLTKLEEKFNTFWEKYRLERAKESRPDMRSQCNELYQRIYSKMIIHQVLFARIDFIRSYGLVVFNEMFFGKNTPFPLGMLEHEIKQLSSEYPTKVLHTNFLVNGVFPDNYREFADFHGFLNQYKGSKGKFEVTNTYTWRDRSYDAYFGSFFEMSFPIRTLENISKTYFCGQEISNYRKSTYKGENDEFLESGAFYMFGNGRDEKARDTSEATASILLENLATEICYDLNLGVRRQIDSYPPNLKIFDVPSNTLGFTHESMVKLPESHRSKVVFHVDPTEQAVLTSVPTVSTLSTYNELTQYADLAWQKKQTPLLILQFELENSLYQIKLWDITQHLL